MTYKSKSLTLYYTRGSSDKEYQVWIEQDSTGCGYDVYGLNGRRYRATTKQVKAEGVSIRAAERLFDELVDAKQKKGYTTVLSGVPFSGVSLSAAVIVAAPRTVALAPALWRDTADEDDFDAFLEDEAFVVQEVVAGVRVLLHIDSTGDVCCTAPGSSTVPALPAPLMRELSQNLAGFFLDALYAADSGRLAISDCCRDAPDVTTACREPFSARYQRIKGCLDKVPCAHIELLPLFEDEEKYPAVVAFEQSSRQRVLLRRKQGAYGLQDPEGDYTVVHHF